MYSNVFKAGTMHLAGFGLKYFMSNSIVRFELTQNNSHICMYMPCIAPHCAAKCFCNYYLGPSHD